MKFSSILVVTIVVLAYNQILANGEPKFNGEHVCNKTITVKREKRIEEPVSYQIPYNTVCDLIRTCIQYRTETRINSRKVTVWEEKVIPACCPGYAEHLDQTCRPLCIDGCRFGECIAPNVCRCDGSSRVSQPRYMGKDCSIFACREANKWGPYCDEDCSCSPNAFCHGSTGKCICRSNWRGPNCTEACESNKEPGCEQFTLLQLSDPEANMIIRDDTLPRSSALSLELQPSSAPNGDPSDTRSQILFALSQTNIIMVLLFITFTLIYMIYRYRQRLENITNELYYSATSSSRSDISSSGGSGLYAVPSTTYSEPSSRDSIAAAMQKRPLVPTPKEADEHASQLSKNLSFASATRNIIKGVTTTGDLHQPAGRPTSKEASLRGKFLLDPLVESRLARSQDKASENVYCLPKSQEFTTLNIDTNQSDFPNLGRTSTQLSASISDDHYQVPKSPNITNINNSNSNFSGQIVESEQLISQSHNNKKQADDDLLDDESNIYEEIPPRRPSDSQH